MADYTIPTSPLKRLRYYNNQFLTEKDFIDDQAANLSHERAQLRALCAPGVWEGLVVSYAGGTAAPSVAAGIAADDQGRLIVLGAAASGPTPATLGNGNFVLSIAYNEVATDMSTNTGGAAGIADNTRFTSQPQLAATAANAVPASAVVLGSFTVSSGQITAHTDAGRQYAGLRLPGPGTPPATLTNRNDGTADGAQLAGTLSVLKTSATAIGPSLTLANPNAGPGGANAGGAIDFNSYDPGSNAPGLRIQSLGDANFSSHLSVLTKAPGAIGNALVERLRITSAGAAQFSGAVSAQSLSAATYSGTVNFTGTPTFSGTTSFTGAVTASGQVTSVASAETSVAPLAVNRDFQSHNRSLVDHNGYRMGQVTEIDETWRRASTQTIQHSHASAVHARVPNTISGGVDGGAGDVLILSSATSGEPFSWDLNSLRPGNTVTAIQVPVNRADAGNDFTVRFVDQTGTSGTTFVANVRSNSGTGNSTLSLAGSLLPWTLAANHHVVMDVASSTAPGLATLFSSILTVIVDPEGWLWTTTQNGSNGSRRQYLDPTADINQRQLQLIGLGSAQTGVMTLEAYECFLNADVAYTMEWMMRTGTISDASNTRQFALGVQNNNAGAGNRFVYFFNQGTTANWQLRVQGSAGAGDTDTGVAITANTVYRMRLEILGANVSSAGTGNFRVRGFINGNKVGDVVVSSLPTADLIRPYFLVGSVGAGGPYDYSVGRVRRVWNHRASGDSL